MFDFRDWFLFIFIGSVLALDCRDVYYYHCPYDGKNIPPQAITSDQQNTGIAIPSPYLGGWSHPWTHAKGNDTSGRVLCSTHQDAFIWVNNNEQKDIQAPSLQIDSQYWFGADGFPTWIGFGYPASKTLTSYLVMNCNLTSKEAAPDIEDTSFISWKTYNFTIPKNAVKGGVDSPQNIKYFYIGIAQFHGETYLVKIIQDTTWLELISTNPFQPIYITSAREIKILCSDDQESLVWVQLNTVEGISNIDFYRNDLINGNILGIFRCRSGLEYFLTKTPELCRGSNIEALVSYNYK